VKSYVLDRKIVIKLKDNCNHCQSKIDTLNDIFERYDKGGIVFRDFKLTIELTSDWLEGQVFHLNNVTIEKR